MSFSRKTELRFRVDPASYRAFEDLLRAEAESRGVRRVTAQALLTELVEARMAALGVARGPAPTDARQLALPGTASSEGVPS